MRSDFLAVGGFDNSFGRGCEDVDFSWRAQLSGLELKIAHGCFLYYVTRSSLISRYRQNRAYARAGVLLWLRFKSHPVNGKSFKWSVQELGRVFAGTPRIASRSTKQEKLDWAGRIGGAVGSLEGHIRYRIGPVPPRRLLSLVRS